MKANAEPSLGAAPQGVASLAKELRVSEAAVRDYLRSARSILDVDVVAALERPVDTSKYPLGMRVPRSPSDSDG